MKNISISNVFCSGYTAVVLNGCVEDVTVRDIFVTEKGRHALSVARVSGGKHVSLNDENNVTTARNITVSGVGSHSSSILAAPCQNGRSVRNKLICGKITQCISTDNITPAITVPASGADRLVIFSEKFPGTVQYVSTTNAKLPVSKEIIINSTGGSRRSNLPHKGQVHSNTAANAATIINIPRTINSEICSHFASR